MAKQNIIVSGAGATVTFNGTAISDINTIAFSVYGERDEIDLTTLDASGYKVGRLGDLVGIEDVVINKKFDPEADLAIVKTNRPLVIVYKVGTVTTKTLTFWAMFKGASGATIERSPSGGINNDLTFCITNMNSATAATGTLAERGPTFS